MLANYAQARGEIKTGDLISFRGADYLSKIVQWWTKSEYSHVGLALWLQLGEEEEPRLCIVDASLGGIRLTPLSWLVKRYEDKGGAVYWQNYGKDNGESVLSYALKHWGKAYPSKIQFLLIAGWQKLMGWIGKMKKWKIWAKMAASAVEPNADLQKDRFHCAELIEHSLRKVDNGQALDKTPVMVTPLDVTKFDCYGERKQLTTDKGKVVVK